MKLNGIQSSVINLRYQVQEEFKRAQTLIDTARDRNDVHQMADMIELALALHDLKQTLVRMEALYMEKPNLLDLNLLTQKQDKPALGTVVQNKETGTMGYVVGYVGTQCEVSPLKIKEEGDFKNREYFESNILEVTG